MLIGGHGRDPMERHGSGSSAGEFEIRIVECWVEEGYAQSLLCMFSVPLIQWKVF